MNLWAIDGNCVSYRMFCASKLKAADGQGTSAIFGMTGLIRHLMDEERPDRILVAWDIGKSKHRREIFPEYKGSRGKHKTPEDEAKLEDYRRQQAVCKGLLMAMGVDQAAAKDVEADDILAWYAITQGSQHNVTVVSTDQDLYGLVQWGATIFEPFGKRRVVNAANFHSLKGVLPHQWLDYRVMVGDNSDEIPGVHGVGPAKATKLLEMYGDCDGIRAHGPTAPGATKGQRNDATKVAEQWDIVERNRQLMDLTWITRQDFTVPVAPGRLDMHTVHDMFQRYQLRQYLAEWPLWELILDAHQQGREQRYAGSSYGRPALQSAR